jgi:magnesium transporter
VTEIIEALDDAARGRIGALLRDGHFFWIDLTSRPATRGELAEVLGIPAEILRPLLDFEEGDAPSRKFRADGRHVVFAFTCYLESGQPEAGTAYRLRPVEVHVLVTGDYVLTLHEEPASLPEQLAFAPPAGRSEQYVVYAILDAMVANSFDALNEAELTLDGLLVTSTDLRAGRVRMQTLRAINARLSGMRRRAGPQRGLFERIGVEIGRIEGLEADEERYFERIGDQLDRLVDAIDAATGTMATLIDLRLNETTYWLTVVATIFLPLTFVTGFFGMNFEWMIGEVDSELAFWLWGVGTLVIGVALIWRLVVRGSPVAGE